jgi:DNA-binding transcriptional MerR regulator
MSCDKISLKHSSNSKSTGGWKKMYTVKEIAKKMKLSEHTVRYYSDRELIPTMKRKGNNIRTFSDDCVNWLTVIKCLKQTGVSIEVIKTYVDYCLQGDETLNQRYEIIKAQREVAQEQLLEAKGRVDFIEKKLKFYEDLMHLRIIEE